MELLRSFEIDSKIDFFKIYSAFQRMLERSLVVAQNYSILSSVSKINKTLQDNGFVFQNTILLRLIIQQGEQFNELVAIGQSIFKYLADLKKDTLKRILNPVLTENAFLKELVFQLFNEPDPSSTPEYGKSALRIATQNDYDHAQDVNDQSGINTFFALLGAYFADQQGILDRVLSTTENLIKSFFKRHPQLEVMAENANRMTLRVVTDMYTRIPALEVFHLSQRVEKRDDSLYCMFQIGCMEIRRVKFRFNQTSIYKKVIVDLAEFMRDFFKAMESKYGIADLSHMTETTVLDELRVFRKVHVQSQQQQLRPIQAPIRQPQDQL
ncbi:hypothetical protein FGO68_gene6464 [Halteria grandinella]|uniref:Uncharacterized protein n=1 Tax=Halteria grandinella TaxID=5974 RepID=A0A8J8T4I0_HALGN|nr:hypothetical protein FGO68_gene6464 [Halteria grandinella]